MFIFVFYEIQKGLSFLYPRKVPQSGHMSSDSDEDTPNIVR